MAAKRKNNGLGPGKLCKNICQVPFTKREWSLFQRLQDDYDATSGWVVAKALKDLMKRRYG